MTERHVNVETNGRIAVVYLDRPEKRNSYTPLMALQLQEALEALDADTEVSVIVVTGTGSISASALTSAWTGGTPTPIPWNP